jgi:hypothetical protein
LGLLKISANQKIGRPAVSRVCTLGRGPDVASWLAEPMLGHAEALRRAMLAYINDTSDP